MRNARLTLLTFLLATGGATLLGGCTAEVIYAANDGIVFTNSVGEPSDDVLRVAQAHCHRFGKRTRYDGRDGAFHLKFQCVE